MTKNDSKSSDSKYKEFLNNAKEKIVIDSSMSQESLDKTVHIARYKAKISNIMIILSILLLLIPITTLFSYLYYGINNQANQLIKTSSELIYVTEPNVALSGDINTTIKFFNMNEKLDIIRHVGKQDLNYESRNINYIFSQVSDVERDSKGAFPTSKFQNSNFVFPKKPIKFNTQNEWRKLDSMPAGSVAEAFISFDALYSPKEVQSKFSENMDARWVAVNSGQEELSSEGDFIPLGYPLKSDDNMYSPFHTQIVSKKGLEQTFLDTVNDLAEHQKIVSSVPYYQNVSFIKQQNYLKNHGIQAYGVVVTGPVNELKKLQSDKSIRAIKIGEVALWNWE